MVRLTFASSARRHSSRRECSNVCDCESEWPALATHTHELDHPPAVLAVLAARGARHGG